MGFGEGSPGASKPSSSLGPANVYPEFLVAHVKHLPLQPYLIALRGGTLHGNGLPAPDVALLDLTHRPGKPTPDHLVVVDLEGKQPAILPGLEDKDFGHVRPIGGPALPASHDVSVGRSMLHHDAKVPMFRRHHGCFNRILPVFRKGGIDRPDGTGNLHILLNPQVILSLCIFTVSHHRHLSRSELDLVSSNLRLEAGVAEQQASRCICLLYVG